MNISLNRPHRHRHPLRRWHVHRHRYNCYNRVYVYQPRYWDAWPIDDYWFDGDYHTTVVYGWPGVTRTYDTNFYYVDSTPSTTAYTTEVQAVVPPTFGGTSGYDASIGYVDTATPVLPEDTGGPVVWAAGPQTHTLTTPAPTQPAMTTTDAQESADLGLPPGIRQGDAAFAGGLYEEARRWYIRAVIADDTDGYAKMLYGYASFADGDYGVAALAISRALAHAPDLVENPISLTALYNDDYSLQQHLALLTDEVRVRESMQDAGELRFLLGYLQFASNQPDAAMTTLKSLVGNSDDSGASLADLVYEAASRQGK